MGSLYNRFGPGLMLAASAVGVSHIVQSTRAGASYGLSLLALVVVITLLKYPAFRFGAVYASSTGNNLIQGYANQGRWALWLFAAILPIDMFIATAAVSLVTASLLISVFGIDLSVIHVAVFVVVVSVIVLFSGRYAIFENITKVFVVLFTLLTVTTFLLVCPQLIASKKTLLPVLSADKSTFLFMIAIAGWMPTSITASVFQSLWVCEKNSATNQAFSYRQAITDFNFGYFLTLVLALCFVFIGAAVLYQASVTLGAGAGQFAGQFIGLFTSVIGDFSYPIVAVAAIAVMWSSVLTLLDAPPRAVAEMITQVKCSTTPVTTVASFNVFSIAITVQALGVIAVLLFFMKSFTTFIDFATSIAFISAPILAFLNFSAVTSSDMPEENRPSGWLIYWNWIGIISMAFFAIAFVYFRLV